MVTGEAEINQGRVTLPANTRTEDRFAGRRVVTIGGGSGTFSLLSHLKKYPFKITAIVTMSDSGGSSRMLMDEFRRQLPLGDLRMSLVALARNASSVLVIAMMSRITGVLPVIVWVISF